MNKLIWTPNFIGQCDFEIYLDCSFAKEMLDSKITLKRQLQMNGIANDLLKILNVNHLNPYTFHKDSCFVEQFYTGQNGVWLSTDYQSIESLVKGDSESLIKYTSHNVDRPDQAYVLMVLVDKWVQYSDILREH